MTDSPIEALDLLDTDYADILANSSLASFEVQEANTTNIFNASVVQVQAVALGYVETARWIQANPQTYYNGIFRGFAALST